MPEDFLAGTTFFFCFVAGSPVLTLWSKRPSCSLQREYVYSSGLFHLGLLLLRARNQKM